MNIDAISIGKNPPDEINVVIEVPIGGEPIKYEMDKEAGILVVDRFLYTAMRYPGNYGFIPHIALRRRRPVRRHRGQYARDRARGHDELPTRRRPDDGGRIGRRREDRRGPIQQADAPL